MTPQSPSKDYTQVRITSIYRFTSPSSSLGSESFEFREITGSSTRVLENRPVWCSVAADNYIIIRVIHIQTESSDSISLCEYDPERGNRPCNEVRRVKTEISWHWISCDRSDARSISIRQGVSRVRCITPPKVRGIIDFIEEKVVALVTQVSMFWQLGS